MADDPNATGTTGADPQGGSDAGTAGDPQAGGPAGDESLDQIRAERDRLKSANDQWLREKSNIEEERRRYAESQSELERYRQGSGATLPTAGDPAMAQLQRDYESAKAGDPEAILRIMAVVGQTTEQQVTALRRENAYEREMGSVPSAMQEEVRRRCAAIPGLSPSWALKDLKAERLDKHEKELEERRRKLDEEEAARKRGRVDTSVTPIPGSDLRTQDMTPDEYERLCQAAEKGDRKALSRLKDYDAGRVKMKS